MIITLQTLIFFRESLLNALDRLLRPYYNKLSLAFGRNGEATDDEESDEQVFAEYDEERGVVFYPPMYLQRYAAVSDCLMDEQWSGKLEKVVDLGYHDMSFINYLKEVQGIKCILGVDLESIPLRCSIDLTGCEDYVPKREKPLEVTLFKGNAADPDYRLIGCDAVIAIEMIEHMLPHDLDRLIHTVFGFIKPWIAIFTTPNGDFNVLFKALEKNGLRRLDHFFEWSREQFHDWCSNIVIRYPQYTVLCKGIGPGPTGTKHLGCCSQLALFVSKEYDKQQDLNLNSLALVSDTPSPHSITNLISSWETSDIPNESNMIEPPKNTESYSELQSPMKSSITLLLSTPSSSLDTILYRDKTSQCNLDTETERNYLMFDYEQMCCDVLKPRKTMNNHRVYEFEDVCNRLNCTTLEVNKFSKTTLNLMAKNKLDTLVHTREVVDEIRHLTKLLNFNKEFNNQLENGTHTWHNINWGENAPYWNQYYKIVKAYNYPFEVKSDECRILDLISDEINRLIDTRFDEDFSFEVNRLEIPIALLMPVVAHITDDAEKVKDLLEWNGYEVIGNFVIHSRMVVDYSSAGTQEEDTPTTTDVYSDWDSTSLSDGSTAVPDYHARCLRRALDQKVRRLRSMLTADEDITTELDQVVCRLMKLALRTSKGRNTPPPTRWMQCKLLDLLTLTEKTIERRKRHFIESYPLNAINYEEKSEEMIALEKIKEDDTALKIVDKYKHLVNHTDDMDVQYRYLDFDLEDDLSIISAELAKDYEFIDKHQANPILEPNVLPGEGIFRNDDIAPEDESKLQRTQAWVEEDIEVVPYPIHDGNFDNSSIDTYHNTTKLTKYYRKRFKGKQINDVNCVTRKKSHSKAHKLTHRVEDNSNTKLVKKHSRKKTNSNSSEAQTIPKKIVSHDARTVRDKSRRKLHKSLYATAAKPGGEFQIPASVIELCHPEIMIGHDIETFNRITASMTKVDQDKTSLNTKADVAATKESMIIEIITEEAQETIALRRTIGTDADADSMIYEDEKLIRSVSNTFITEDDVFEKHDIATENVHSQTIFLYDIDEPTTSKGIRHTGMDVQCGPDSTAPTYSMLSATTSLTRVPKMFTTGIKIGDSTTDTKITYTDFGTCTYDDENNYRTIIPRNRTVGIKIKDSDSNIIVNRMELPTMSTYSALSTTTSLSKISNLGKSVGNSENDNVMINTDFGSYADTPKVPDSIFNDSFPLDTSVDIKIDNSINLNNPATTVDAKELYNCTPDVSKVTTIFESSITNNVNENSDNKQILINNCPRNPQQQLYDKLIKSPKLFKSESEQTTEPCVEFNDFSLNQSKRIVYETKSQGSGKKFNSLSKRTFKSQSSSSKGIRKKSVDFQLQHSVSHIPKRLKCPTKAQRPSKELTVLPNKTTNSISLKQSASKTPEAVYDNNPAWVIKQQTELQCLTHTKLSDISNTITPSPSLENEEIPFYKNTSLKISKLKNTLVDVAVEDHKSNLPEKRDFQAETQYRNDGSQVSQTYSEMTLLKSHGELNIDESTSDICVSVDRPCKTTLHSNSMSSSDLQNISVSNKSTLSSDYSERSAAKKFKQKLCSGGVQMYSYRDKQAVSEDIMYQGQWQQNKPKVLAKKKCRMPVVYKRNESNLKKKVNSKELTKSSIASSNERSRNIGKNNKYSNLKPDLRKPSLPSNTTANVKQELNINVNKQKQKLSNTVCAGIVAKPFRNILKVPSKFPISNLPYKNPKSFTTKKAPITTTLPVKKDEITVLKGIRKNYIPLYLREKKLNSADKISRTDLNLSLDSVTTEIKKSKESVNKQPKLLIRSKTEEIKRDLLKFRSEPSQKEYVVFRNEIEKNKSDGQPMKNTSESVRKKDVSRQRFSTPTSANSSTCSSPCSIATVRAVSTRAKNAANRLHSSPPFVNNTANTGSENSTPERNKKLTKRKKVCAENKENIPQTSNHFNVSKKDSAKLGKSIFASNKKDVYISQVKDSLQSTAITPSKQKVQKSCIIRTPKTFTDKKSSPLPSPSLSNKTSFMLDVSSSTVRNDVSECAQTSNMVLILEPQTRQCHLPAEFSKPDDTNANSSNASTSINNTSTVATGCRSTQNINSSMRELLEETLDFIQNPNFASKTEYIADSDLVIYNLDHLPPQVKLSASPTSFKTVITSDDNNDLLPSDIEYALNRSFDTTLGNESLLSLNDTHLTVTDFDALSFKSITSGSKLSGYLSADNEFSSSIKLPKCSMAAPASTSVREIFERKDQHLLPTQNQNTTGALANQAFSGFTINGDSMVGDKPDLVNIIDSETGSLLAVAARQVTSEELLISGRSSDSFESCVLDDDAVVPNWLFQLISQQGSSMDELEPPAEMLPLPVVEPLFDENANVMEAPGAGAGAGDGRGIHSDHSQDSSGRGTSASSSDTSSGPQSEVILIDPAAFAAQFELLRDAVEGSVVMAINNPDTLSSAAGRQVSALVESEPQSLSGGESRRPPRLLPPSASDADADVSSLDTDELPDSSDN